MPYHSKPKKEAKGKKKGKEHAILKEFRKTKEIGWNCTPAHKDY